MSASTKTSSLESSTISQNIQKLGILAGGGELPRLLIEFCLSNNIEPYIVGFDGQTDAETFKGVEHIKTRIAASGSIFKWMQAQDIQDVVFIGSIKRPHLRSMVPDLTTLSFFLRKGIWARGDNAILEAARVELEGRGFKFHGVHKFLPTLLAPEGILTEKTSDKYLDAIKLGVTESQELGQKDIGQAVLVKDEIVIGRETSKGTNALIREYGEEGAILVKTCKPQQDKDLDLPTIGLGTVHACAEKKMAGIVVHAGNSLFLDQDEAIKLANQSNVFIIGVSV